MNKSYIGSITTEQQLKQEHEYRLKLEETIKQLEVELEAARLEADQLRTHTDYLKRLLQIASKDRNLG